MPNAVNLVKQAAVEAVEAAKPVQLLYGVVVSATPLSIQVDQKVFYSEQMLVLTRNVTDFTLDISLSAETEEVAGHSHAMNGRKKIIVYNGLTVGDRVLLARMQKGKQYLVLDRIKEKPDSEGEWL